MRNNVGTCRGCGKSVLWVKTPAGKNMPCDPTLVRYREDPEGDDRIVLSDGRVLRGALIRDPGRADGMGYIPHWATCPQAGKFKK